MSYLLEILEDLKNFTLLDKINIFPDVYNYEVKELICSIIKKFLNLIENYENPKKIVTCALLYNWMLSHKKKLELYFENHPKFRKVCYEKLFEFGSNSLLKKCPYWKGTQYYIDNLTGVVT